jgi:methionyl-tRNA formyltransferase
MRIAIIGQKEFGEAALLAFQARGAEVAGVFCPPDQDGKQDRLGACAKRHGVEAFKFPSYRAEEARAALHGLNADIGVMAFVTAYVPQPFLAIPRLGCIQFHPSFLPEHRGPSSMNWPIILGKEKTGLTIFRPTAGWDEGPILLQHEVGIAPDDTLGSLYFEKIFPLGIAALTEAAERVYAGTALSFPQIEAHATYEPKIGEAEARIDWAKPAAQVYNLIRGCNPAPGAWSTLNGERLGIYGARLRTARSYVELKGTAPGQVASEIEGGVSIRAGGGFIDVFRCKLGKGAKVAPAEAGLAAGVTLGV